jgi:hypothetical protein
VAVESAPEPRRITDGQRNKENELEKRPTERYRKSRMAKNGNGNLKKKKKNIYFMLNQEKRVYRVILTRTLQLYRKLERNSRVKKKLGRMKFRSHC